MKRFPKWLPGKLIGRLINLREVDFIHSKANDMGQGTRLRVQ
jgi:hypothetical protein